MNQIRMIESKDSHVRERKNTCGLFRCLPSEFCFAPHPIDNIYLGECLLIQLCFSALGLNSLCCFMSRRGNIWRMTSLGYVQLSRSADIYHKCDFMGG